VRRLAALLLLLLAAAAPARDQPRPAAPKPPAAKPEEIAEQLAMLAFDANPLWSIPARALLSRWSGPLRLLVIGRKEDTADARAAMRALRPSGISMRVVAEADMARQRPNAFLPNAFLVVHEDLPQALQGPLRGMLRNAFLGDEAAVDSFILRVVMVTPCWTLPVWTDASRLVLKAALIGVDAALPREQSRACILRGLGAALGLLGPGAFLPGSAFAPGTATRLTRDDARMLRTLYGRALHPGMTRQEAEAAALKALSAPAPRRKKPEQP
jgi:hypothetical protein